MGKVFTLNEAQVLLPVVEALIRRAQGAAKQVSGFEEELLELRQRIFIMGGMNVDVAAMAYRLAEREKAAEEAKNVLAEIDAIGVMVKDLEKGLLDFPSTLDGKSILLCWMLGEKEIAFWHSPEAGYAGRRPVDERFGKTARERLN